MKINYFLSAAAVSAVAIWSSSAALAEDPGKTVTSGGASAGSVTNETPKPNGHGQPNSKDAPVAASKGEGITKDTSAGTGETKAGATPIVTGSSSGASAGSATNESPKPDGHSQANSKDQPVAVSPGTK